MGRSWRWREASLARKLIDVSGNTSVSRCLGVSGEAADAPAGLGRSC